MFLTWLQSEKFVVGDVYVHSETDEAMEFLGIAVVPELMEVEISEKVLVFGDIEYGPLRWLYSYTEADYRKGVTFSAVADALIDDLDAEGDL